MNKLRQALQGRLVGLVSAYKRFPVTIGLAIGLFLFLIINEPRMDTIIGEIWFGRILATWIYAILLAFLIGVHTENKRVKLWKTLVLYGLGILIVLGVYFFVFSSNEQFFVADAEYVYFGLVLATLLGIFLEISLKPGQRVPHKAVEVLNSFAWTGLFSFVIGVGSFLVFAMINYLFQANMRLDHYGRVIFEATMLLFAVPFFLSGLKPSGLTVEGEYDPLFRKLLRYVCLPLAFIYTAILYVYSAKILITRTWPQGLVSHLVLWYSLFVIAVYIFLRADKEKLPKLVDLFPLAVVPLLGMMFGSIGQRIAQYGFTPNRYLVVIAGLWALIALIYIGLRKVYRPWILMASLVLFILIGTNSPIGAYDVSVRSQSGILNNILQAESMLSDGQIVPQSPSEEVRERISETVLWFYRNQAIDRLDYLPQGFTMQDFQAVFGFTPEYPSRTPSYAEYVGFYATNDYRMDVPEGELVFVNLMGQESKVVGDVTVTRTANQLVINHQGQTETMDMEFLRDYLNKASQNQDPIRQELGELNIYLISANGLLENDKLSLQDASLFIIIPRQ